MTFSLIVFNIAMYKRYIPVHYPTIYENAAQTRLWFVPLLYHRTIKRMIASLGVAFCQGTYPLLYYNRCPAVLVLLHAVLYGTEMIIEFRRPRPRLAVLTERIAHTRVEVVDI